MFLDEGRLAIPTFAELQIHRPSRLESGLVFLMLLGGEHHCV